MSGASTPTVADPETLVSNLTQAADTMRSLLADLERQGEQIEQQEDHLEAYRQFTADVMTIWANWTSGRLGEEDAMVAIRDRHTELDAVLGGS